MSNVVISPSRFGEGDFLTKRICHACVETYISHIRTGRACGCPDDDDDVQTFNKWSFVALVEFVIFCTNLTRSPLYTIRTCGWHLMEYRVVVTKENESG